ncbi:hypothetical protein HO173_009987 [Letharia columbiana]|uniref:NB-ARC domain-containing protein n=1 Tax=Letharia columbiana TaxID=112416 RepID=A0A8H6FNA6_9LECA|nr:uncharacterized protein HO173_009987 [Letharia columbiana]KAF6231685.1 hypothetical protein HO173_009987 [Letharia columbiana]
MGSLLSHVASLAFQSPSKQLLETLRHDSDVLTRLSNEFQEINSSFDIINFYERRKTPGLNSLIVDETSSKLGLEDEVLIPIDATHRRICKSQSQTDPLFLPVLAQIKRCSAQITKADQAQVVTNSTTTVVPGHFIVPVSPNPHFVGRTEQMQLLEDCLSAQDYDVCTTYPIVAVHGLGGVGKTQLATRFVYDRKIRKPSASIFWVSARNADEIETGFREIAVKLSLVREANGGVGYARPGLIATAGPAAEVMVQHDGVDLLKGRMLMPGHEDWLLVFDNFDDIKVKIDRFLPIGASGSVLITTRDRKVIGSVATSGFPLTAMDLLDAERLFVRIQSLGAEPNVQRFTSALEREELKQILEELQCFPLEIDQAASFIRENSPTALREYLTYLKPRSVDRERLLRFKQANPTYPDSVMTTWEISLQYLERTQPRSGWILQLLGFLDHSYISEELLTTGPKRIAWMFDANLVGEQLPSKYQAQMAFLEDDVGFRVAIGTLMSLSLVQRHLSGPTLHVHPLVHEWIRVRLNPYPEQQAKFAIVAALVLYQYLPTEMVIWLDYHPTSIPETIFPRINQVSHHIRVVLANLGDYAMHAATIPVECFMLCEVCFLAGFSRHLLNPFDISTALSKDLDRIIKLVISRLSHDQMPLGYFLRRVVLWLRGDLRQRNHLTPVSKMADTFETLRFKISLEERPDDFLMLLASSVVEVCDTLNHTNAEELAVATTDIAKEEPNREEQRRHIRYGLLESLRRLFSSMEPLSTLLRRTNSVIVSRLLRVMTPEEFATQKWFDMKQKLSSDELGLLDFDEKAAYLCLIAELLWEYRGPRYILDLQNVFSTVITECLSMRIKARQSTVLQRDRAGIHALSRSSYISGSFGRDVISKSKTKVDRDLITPLSYIWAITLPVAQVTSDPRQRWKTSRIGDSHIGPLDLCQREWSLHLVSSVSKIYKRLRADQGDESVRYARFLNYFADLSVRYSLMNIYSNLEDWERLQRELVTVLPCDDVLRFCSTPKAFPWEAELVASVEEHASSPPPYTPQHNDQEVFWPFLFSRLFKAARDLMAGQVSHTSGVSEASSESTRLQEHEAKSQNAAAEIESRLEAAASQRQSQEQKRPRNNISRLRALGLPDSFSCIADPNVDSAIAHFFTLAQKKEILNEAEAKDLRLKIRAVARMSPESYAKYLGNLEIIYQLAQKLSAKVPGSMHVGYPSDESDTGSSDDYMEEETDEDIEFDTNAGMTQFDWGW